MQGWGAKSFFASFPSKWFHSTKLARSGIHSVLPPKVAPRRKANELLTQLRLCMSLAPSLSSQSKWGHQDPSLGLSTTSQGKVMAQLWSLSFLMTILNEFLNKGYLPFNVSHTINLSTKNVTEETSAGPGRAWWLQQELGDGRTTIVKSVRRS